MAKIIIEMQDAEAEEIMLLIKKCEVAVDRLDELVNELEGCEDDECPHRTKF